MKPEDPGPIKDKKVKEDLKTVLEAMIDEGMADLQKALDIDKEYDDAMAYMNLLIRERGGSVGGQARSTIKRSIQPTIGSRRPWTPRRPMPPRPPAPPAAVSSKRRSKTHAPAALLIPRDAVPAKAGRRCCTCGASDEKVWLHWYQGCFKLPDIAAVLVPPADAPGAEARPRRRPLRKGPRRIRSKLYTTS